jgi:hypothetical protein
MRHLCWRRNFSSRQRNSLSNAPPLASLLQETLQASTRQRISPDWPSDRIRVGKTPQHCFADCVGFRKQRLARQGHRRTLCLHPHSSAWIAQRGLVQRRVRFPFILRPAQSDRRAKGPRVGGRALRRGQDGTGRQGTSEGSEGWPELLLEAVDAIERVFASEDRIDQACHACITVLVLCALCRVSRDQVLSRSADFFPRQSPKPATFAKHWAVLSLR